MLHGGVETLKFENDHTRPMGPGKSEEVENFLTPALKREREL